MAASSTAGTASDSGNVAATVATVFVVNSSQTSTDACPSAIEIEGGNPFVGGHSEKVAMLSAALVGTVLTFITYIVAASLIARHGTLKTKRGDALMTLSVYPVLSLVAFLSVLLPASAVLCDGINITYLCVVLWAFKHSVMKFFGGKKMMLKELEGKRVSMRSLPLCCCCFCLPTKPVSRKFFLGIRICILQFFVVRPTLGALSSMLWSQNLYDTGQVSVRGSFIYINLANIASTLVVMYGFALLRNAASEHLSFTNGRLKFLLLQAVVILTNLQHIIFTAFAAFGVIGCTRQLPAKARANELAHLTLIGELLFLGVVAAAVYLKSFANEQRLHATAHMELLQSATAQTRVHERATAVNEVKDFQYNHENVNGGHSSVTAVSQMLTKAKP